MGPEGQTVQVFLSGPVDLVHPSDLAVLSSLLLLVLLGVLLLLIRHLDRELPFDQLDRSDLPDLSNPVFLAGLLVLVGLVGQLTLLVLLVL